MEEEAISCGRPTDFQSVGLIAIYWTFYVGNFPNLVCL